MVKWTADCPVWTCGEAVSSRGDDCDSKGDCNSLQKYYRTSSLPYKTRWEHAYASVCDNILFQSFSITIACSCLEHSFPSQEYTVISDVCVCVCVEWGEGKGGGHQRGRAKNRGRGEYGGKSFHSLHVLIKGNMIRCPLKHRKVYHVDQIPYFNHMLRSTASQPSQYCSYLRWPHSQALTH